MSEIAELLDRFQRGPDLLATALAGITEEDLDFRPDPRKWSPRQIDAHLADSEIEAAVRFRRMLAEENPTILGYDQDAWAKELGYEKRDPARSLSTFRLLRQENYELLKDVPPAALQRTSTHSERGVMTLGQWLEIYARHAEKHSNQIRQLRETSRAQSAR